MNGFVLNANQSIVSFINISINPINCGAIAMVGGFPVVWLVSLFTKKMPEKTVDQIFECYR